MFKISKLAILEYIKDQLLFNDSVTLPGLGSFEVVKSPSEIRGNKMIPPTARVIFNPEKTLDDKVLSGIISENEDITGDEASQKVLEFIDEVIFALNKGEAYQLEGFGKLYRDAENVYRFEKDPSYQLASESYGLESFELDPFEENEMKTADNVGVINKPVSDEASKSSPENTKKPVSGTKKAKAEKVPVQNETILQKGSEVPPPVENKNSHNIFWILAGVVMVILVSFFVLKMTTNLLDGTGLSVFKSGHNPGKDLFPEENNWDMETALDNDLGETIDSMTEQENALAPDDAAEPVQDQPAETSEYTEYHIIAGSFKDKENAGILQQQLTEKGYPALVIQQGEQLYRVSAISFKEKEKGLQELEHFKLKTKNNAAWLLGLK